MSQPVQYSNLFFEADPNSLAFKLVSGQNVPPSQREPQQQKHGSTTTPSLQNVESEQRPNKQQRMDEQNRPRPRFEGFQMSSQGSMKNNLAQNLSTPVQTPSTQQASTRFLSRGWDNVGLSTSLKPSVTPMEASQRPVNINRGPQDGPARSFSQMNQTITPIRAPPISLLSQEILPGPASSNPGRTGLALALSSTASARTNSTSAVSLTRIPASHAPTFRPPRHVIQQQQASSSTNPHSFLLGSDPAQSQESNEYETSKWFESGDEEIFPRTFPGPALDAWTISNDMNSQNEYSSQRYDPSRRIESATEEHARYGRGGIFSKGPWLSFCSAYDQPPILENDVNGEALVCKFNCDEILRKGLGNNAQKVPFLALAVIKLGFFEHYATATMADPTGEIEAEIHEDVLRSDHWSIHEGCVIVLKRVTVCRPLFLGEEVSSHTLIVTPANVERVFAATEPIPEPFLSNIGLIVSGQSRSSLSNAGHHNPTSELPSSPRVPVISQRNPRLPSTIPQPSHIAPKRRNRSPNQDEEQEEEFDEEFFARPFSITGNTTMVRSSDEKHQTQIVKQVQNRKASIAVDDLESLLNDHSPNASPRECAPREHAQSSTEPNTKQASCSVMTKVDVSKPSADDIGWLED